MLNNGNFMRTWAIKGPYPVHKDDHDPDELVTIDGEDFLKDDVVQCSGCGNYVLPGETNEYDECDDCDGEEEEALHWAEEERRDLQRDFNDSRW